MALFKPLLTKCLRETRRDRSDEKTWILIAKTPQNIQLIPKAQPKHTSEI